MSGDRKSTHFLGPRALCAIAFTASAFACGPPPQPPPPAGNRAPVVTGGSPEAQKLLGDLPARARRAGAGPLAFVAGGQVEEGGRMGAFVDTDERSCVLFYGRASQSVDDLDAAAFSDDGNPLAVDEGPDPRPTLLLCPPHPRRLYISIHIAQGEGFAAVGAQIVPREHAVDVARAVGARGVLGGSPRRPEAWPGLEDRVRAHRAVVSNAFEEVRRVAVPLDANAATRVELPQEADGCADALIVPDDDIAVVEVEAIDDGGRIVARATESSENERTIQVCSPASLPVSLSLRPHVGRGLAAVVLFRAKGDALKGDPMWRRNDLTLDKAKSLKNESLKKAGYAPPPKEIPGDLRTGQRAKVSLALKDVGCTRIDVVGGAPLALVDATVLDDKGDVLSQNGGSDGAIAYACGRKAAELWLEARGTGGPYVVLARQEKTDAKEFTDNPTAAARALGRIGRGLERDEGTVAVKSLPLENGRVSKLDVPLAAGQCARVAAGIHGDAFGVVLRMLDEGDGTELDRAEGESSAMVYACADRPRTVSVEATTAVGKTTAVFVAQTAASKRVPPSLQSPSTPAPAAPAPLKKP